MIDNALVWIPALALLAFAPIMIYLDLKYREVANDDYWWWMVGICSPCVFILYYTGVYPAVLIAVSLISAGLYFVLMRAGAFEGADFMYLMMISLFFVENPLSGHVLMPVSFGIFLIATVVIVNFAAMLFPEKDTGEFPMMIPIAAAFIITLVLA